MDKLNLLPSHWERPLLTHLVSLSLISSYPDEAEAPRFGLFNYEQIKATSRGKFTFAWRGVERRKLQMTTMACASSHVMIPARAHVNKSQFLGFSLAPSSARCRIARPSSNYGKMGAVKCSKDLSVVPLNQRWMFEESEVNGPDIWNTTWYPKAADHVNTEKPWYIVDATDKILGRLASTIAVHIRGKNLATYTPSVDMGAFVIVVNAEKIAVSGKKRSQKLYRRHSGRPGGMKVETFAQLQQRIPERIIEHAVQGMLSKGRLGRRLFHHLKVYKGPDHPHEAQKPIELPLKDKRIQRA